MVTLWNPADEAQDFVFTLFFVGGHYNLPIHLDPRATRTFNISEIVNSQIPDDEGNVVPAGISEGSAKISGSLGENQDILVAMDAGTYNVQKATCNLICATCNGFTSSSMSPSSVSLVPGGTAQLTAFANWNTGQHYVVSGFWDSSNTNVATVTNGLSGTGSVQAVAAGTAYIEVQNEEPEYESYICSISYPCPYYQPFFASGSVKVQVPTSLKVLNTTILQTGNSGNYGCRSGYYGIQLDIDYQVLDQNSNPIQSSATTPQEYVVWYDGSNNGGFTNIGPSRISTTSQTTRSDGTFDDAPMGLCSPVPFNTPLTSTQTIQVLLNSQAYGIRTNNWKFSSTNLTNHGTVTNSVDVNATQ